MENDVFDWRVHCVSFLPVHVTHPKFFPCELIFLSDVMGSIYQKMSMAKGEMSRSQHSFEWPCHRIYMLLQYSARPGWHAIRIPPILSVLRGWSINEKGLAMHILIIFADVWSSIRSDHTHFSCVRAVKLIYQFCVPVFKEAMMAIEL